MRREDVLYTLVALALLGLCVLDDLNTRIGWPGLYLGQQPWIVTGYIVMWVFFGIALAIMIFSAWTGKPCRLGLVLALLIGGGNILQALPMSATGLQFLPVSPWSFSGWVPFLISACSWVFIGLVVLALVCGDRAVGFPVMMLLLVGVNLPLSFWGLTTPSSERTDHYQRQLAEWREKRDDAQRGLSGLKHDRDALIARLKCLGVQSSADLRHVPAARPFVEELAEVVCQIREQETEAQRLDMAVVEAESLLRRIERQMVIERIGLDKAEEDGVLRMGVELSERLRSIAVLEVDDVLNEMANGKYQERLR